MHLILFAIGAALAVVGIVLIRYGMPVADVGAAAIFTSGIVMHVGGLIVIALAAAVRGLTRIAERLEIQPLPVPPVAEVAREDPAPRPVRPPAVTIAPAPAARSSLLGWLGSRAPAAPKAPAPAASEPQVDLAPLTRVEPPREPPPLVTPPAAPAVPPPLPRAEPKPAAAARPNGILPAASPKPAAPQNGTPATTVYRSGVIDGMAYTLFMDGSIQAQLAQGAVRFATIDELQKYLLERR
jgi:hypothetical protein